MSISNYDFGMLPVCLYIFFLGEYFVKNSTGLKKYDKCDNDNMGLTSGQMMELVWFPTVFYFLPNFYKL